jgi:short-subunit dehydrogenase
VAGKFGIPLRSAYSAAKAALLMYMDSLRAELTAQVRTDWFQCFKPLNILGA